ncbi:MAG: 2Fe-2S iron-sulfur cluster-binding protein [Cyclobacteriaceae bacterium]|nr:2Fe-2S iron-sulfur cluster-binding protein [Cyclobacteriaceae bacterium]
MEVKVKIDGIEKMILEGQTINDVLKAEGAEIPTMCYFPGTDHFPTCLVCIVKDQRTGRLVPSCSTKVAEGMDIITLDDDVKEARKTALDLLLSDHVGECDAPCQKGCPANMDIPHMNRLLAKGRFDEALKVVKKDIALPAVLGRICPAPCERACRRRMIDEPVSICLLKRYAADHDLGHDECFLPDMDPPNGKKTAVIGAGPAGLAAAYFLLQKGYACTVYDKNPLPGGTLRYEVPDDKLPKNVLDEEVEIIKKMGAVFEMGRELAKDELKNLRNEYDGVIVATGEDNADFDGLIKKHRSFIVEKNTHKSNMEGVFAIGSAIKPGRVAIRAVAHGKEAAYSLDQYLKGETIIGEPQIFTSRFGPMMQEEHEAFMSEADEHPRVDTVEHKGFTLEEVQLEAARCMHCDCREKVDCSLRANSELYGAEQKKFFPKDRPPVRKSYRNEPIVYEPEKCIKCGICIKVTKMENDALGLTYIGKGFDVEIDVPFNNPEFKIQEQTAIMCAENCPTGALTLVDNVEKVPFT